MRNVIYIGKVLHNGEIYQGIHEPIISEEIFALAQKIHKEKQRNFRVYKNFLFGGLIKCEECGSPNSVLKRNFFRRQYIYAEET